MLKYSLPLALVGIMYLPAAGDEGGVVVNHLPAPANSPWRSSETTNFRLHAYRGEEVRGAVLQACEKLRRELSIKWSGEELAAWKVPCHVVLHPSQASYERAVGPGLAGTKGASSLEFDRHDATRVKLRRLDLVFDPSGEVPALAHELTHVLLVDWCDGRQPPRWFDEGLALIADSPAKQRLHRRDLQTALSNGTSYKVAELIALDDYPGQRRIPAFYAQSLTLTRWLSERDEPAKLLEFLALGETAGYDAALRELYGVDGLAELEQLWLTHCESLATLE